MPDPLDVARSAALAGGRVLASRAGSLGEVRTKSSASDFVTDVDIASGVAVAREIAEAWPGARFVIEETEVYAMAGVRPGDLRDPEVWVVDPLDGTTSYMHGYPCYSVSVALVRDGQPVAGAVFNAAAGEMNAAAAGCGATRDGRALRCGTASTIETALLITGFPYDRTATLDRQLAIFSRVLRRVHGVRRDGSAAIDCCHVAAGRADGFWELALKPWDTAAGTVILRESGALVTDFEGSDWDVTTADTIAANPRLHAELLELVQEALRGA
ncbi:MAG TPA: inositol monophosphatase family protein [Coriobacteriia bacterium]